MQAPRPLSHPTNSVPMYQPSLTPSTSSNTLAMAGLGDSGSRIINLRDRCNMILRNTPNHPRKSQMKSLAINTETAYLMHSYINEIASASIEEAVLLAKHRNSNMITKDDINLILAKKFGLDPGSKTKTHMQYIKSLPVLGQEVIPTSSSTTTQSSSSSAVAATTPGMSSSVKNVLTSTNAVGKKNATGGKPGDAPPKKKPVKRKQPDGDNTTTTATTTAVPEKSKKPKVSLNVNENDKAAT